MKRGVANIDVPGVTLSRHHTAVPPRHTVSLAPTQVEAMPLHELVARWSDAQARPCLCGGVILAKVGDPGPGVREHQSRPQHRRWAAKVYG